MTLRMFSSLALSGLLATSLSACQASDDVGVEKPSVEKLGVEIVERHPFDETSFTQGLEVDENGSILVGTGRTGESRIYRTTTADEQSHSHDLDEELFGEGITRHGDTVWQLTWQAGTAIERDATTLTEKGRASYPGEGWGLCAQQDRLILSDGTDELRYLAPEDFSEIGRVPITLEGEPLAGINELECVGDEVYANIFMSTDIVRIDPDSGEVTALIDASRLPNNGPDHPDAVLNGIAHLPGTDRFYLTGKWWPDLYEVRFVPSG